MKRILSLLLVIAVAVGLVAGLTLPVSAESLYIRKIVSVVYDDSGSMKGDKWAYAKYAMQPFCGMLNSEDQLYITYMAPALYYTGYEPEKIDLSAGGIQNSVDDIRDHVETSSTPYSAVQIAFDKLSKVQDDNPNTQYWLVVITDGVFDEFNGMTYEAAEDDLTDKFEDFADETMPNGTNPQITFMTIGSGDIVSPRENQGKGIYTYGANDAKSISATMSEMADRISGRTRLSKSDVKQLSDTTLQVSSSIPLLNIAVLAQNSGAKIVKATANNEGAIPVSREASLSYPGYSSLAGGAFLLGDSSNAIPSGSYEITFDKAVKAEDIVFLFEPALEMRMTVILNGQKVEDFDELDNAMEGDKIDVSCKIYEMGTDHEISPSLLPPGTTYEINIAEDGKITKQVSGEKMELKDYSLHQAKTELTASVQIAGFNPISRTVKFAPTQYVAPTTQYIPPIVYTIDAAHGSSTHGLNVDQLSGQHDLSIVFKIYEDGKLMTDPSAVQALNPQIEVAPQGNGGKMEYADDGTIVFIPDTARAPSGVSGGGSFDVTVECKLPDGTSACEKYAVLLSDYQIFATDADESIVKTEFYNNRIGASFYITKDGNRLGKADVEKGISISLNEAYKGFETEISVAADGTITVVPVQAKEHPLNFGSWWFYWWHYFGLPGEDVRVTLSHSFGSAEAKIPVVSPSFGFQLLNVYLPLLIELAVLAYLIWWIYAIFAKAKFTPGTAIYTATLLYNADGYHKILTVEENPLDEYNKLKYRWRPTLKTETVSVCGDLSISATCGGGIVCQTPIWYKGRIKPLNAGFALLNTPHDVQQYIMRNKSMAIELITPFDTKQVKAVESIDGPQDKTYYVATDLAALPKVDGIPTIKRALIFAYAHQHE